MNDCCDYHENDWQWEITKMMATLMLSLSLLLLLQLSTLSTEKRLKDWLLLQWHPSATVTSLLQWHPLSCQMSDWGNQVSNTLYKIGSYSPWSMSLTSISPAYEVPNALEKRVPSTLMQCPAAKGHWDDCPHFNSFAATDPDPGPIFKRYVQSIIFSRENIWQVGRHMYIKLSFSPFLPRILVKLKAKSANVLWSIQVTASETYFNISRLSSEITRQICKLLVAEW